MTNTTNLTPNQVERIIIENVPYIRERMAIYGWTVERLENLWNPYDLAHILPEELYDYARDCEISYYTQFLIELLTEEDEVEDF